MKKKIFILFLVMISVFACAFSLVACNTDNKETHTTHNWSSTYTEDGDRHYQTCDGCNEKQYSNHDYGTSGICACGKTKPTEGHTHIWSTSWSSNATKHWHVCTKCSEKKDEANHIAGVAATSTTPQLCSVCKYVLAEPLGHTHSTTLVTAKSASCTENGNNAYYTCNCGKWFSDFAANYEIADKNSVIINALNHKWETEWTIDIEATTEHAGSKSHHCLRCTEKTDVTEIPRLTVTTYNVIFNANGGKIDGKDTKTIMGTVNQKTDRPNDPVRAGYTFMGWYKDGATTTLWDFNTDIIKGATTLYAGWEMNATEYDVTFVLNYPSAANTVKSTENGLITYIPIRTGYIFNGWYYSDGQTADGSYILSEKYDTSKRVTQSGLTLYAEWVQQRTSDSQLYSPSVSISENGVFSWDAVNGAQGYKVEVYSGTFKKSEESLTTTSWTFPNGMTAGYYTVKIRANGDGEHTINSVFTEKYYPHLILGSTSIQFNISTSVLTWATVKNATSYEVRINNTLKTTITYTTYDLSDLDAGDYTVSITAKRSGYTSSVSAQQVSKKRLKTPSVIVTENISNCTYTVSWSAVTHADTYRIKHHDTYIVVTGTSYVINNDSPIYDSNGIGEFTVCAYDSNADYFISADCESKTVKKMYSVTLNRNNNSAGTASTAKKSYQIGENVTISANTNTGYTWLGWYNGTQKLTNELNYTFKMPRENVTYTAQWCKITIMSSDSSAGSVDGLNNTYKVGDSATISASTNTGYTWVGWYNGTQKLTDNLSYTFNMPSENVTYTAKWGKVTIMSSDNSAGSVDGLNNTYKVGDSATISASTNIGYTWIGWYNGAQKLTDELSYTFPMPSENVTYTAKWGKVTVVSEDKSAGTVTSLDSTYNVGDTVTITVSPEGIGYTFIGWFDDEDIKLTTDLSYTFRMPSESKTYIAKWKLDDALSNFIFKSTKTTLTITGIVDKTVMSIFIPAYVTSIQESALTGCTNLTSITVDGQNTTYRSESNCLIQTATKTLILGCKNSAIPSTVTSIGASAFSGYSGLTSIVIPSTVTSIGANAFSGCSALTIYCEVESKPSGWNYSWNPSNRPVVWDCKNNDKDEKGYAYVTVDGLLYGIQGTEATVMVQPSTVSGAITILSSVTYNGASYSVTSITDKAFSGLSITSVVIPEGVTGIGKSAFAACSSLRSVTIPDSVTRIGSDAFYNSNYIQYYTYDNAYYLGNANNNFLALVKATNTSITSCSIHENTKIIVSYAFYCCDSIKSISIPDGIVSIGEYVFMGSKGYTLWEKYFGNLSTTTYNNGKYLGNSTNPYLVLVDTVNTSITSCTIHSNTKIIYYQAFSFCSSLTSINIPAQIIEIGNGAFRECSGLTSITVDTQNTKYQSETNCLIETATRTLILGCKNSTIPSGGSVTNIGSYAFYRCKDFSSITIPNCVTSIGDYAFYYCSELLTIAIPISVMSIGEYAFYGSEGLTIYCEVKNKPGGWDSKWNSYKNSSFFRSVVWDCKNNDKDEDGYAYVITNGIKYSVIYNSNAIGLYSRWQATVVRQSSNLNEVTIPESVVYNGNTYDVLYIGESAFSNCLSLTKITLSAKIVSIRNYAFYNCDKLTQINYLGTTSGWNNISKSSNIYPYHGNYTITCSDGTI